MALRPLAPEASASANSATSAVERKNPGSRNVKLYHARRLRTLSALLRHHVLEASLEAREIFLDLSVRVWVQPQRTGIHHPRLKQHRVFHRCLPPERVAFAANPLGHFHVDRVKPARPREPCLVVEIDGFHNQLVAFPSST